MPHSNLAVTSKKHHQRHQEQRRFGKDHLIFADWVFGGARHQRKTKDGKKMDYLVREIRSKDGAATRITLESPSRIGLPIPWDTRVFVALVTLTTLQGCASDKVPFVPTQILQTMRRAEKDANYKRLAASLKRLTAVTITLENIWYSRKTRRVEDVLVTGILAEAKLICKKGRRAAEAMPESYVQWTATMFESMKDGNLVDLDLDFFYSLKHQGAEDLMRHTNKVWHGGRKPKPYARDLRDLACGQLGMKDDKDLRRNFHSRVRRLHEVGWLKTADDDQVYQQVCPGVWRVHLEIHPDRSRSRGKQSGGEGTGVCSSTVNDATALAALYHQHRFGRNSHQPQPKEITRAKELLHSHSFKLLAALTPQVAQAVAYTYGGKDLYFGAAVPHYLKAIEEHARQTDRQTRKTIEQTMQQVRKAASAQENQDRSRRKRERVAQWRARPVQELRIYRQAAIDHAQSTGDLRRLRRWTDLKNPPLEALDEMDAALAQAA